MTSNEPPIDSDDALLAEVFRRVLFEDAHGGGQNTFISDRWDEGGHLGVEGGTILDDDEVAALERAGLKFETRP